MSKPFAKFNQAYGATLALADICSSLFQEHSVSESHLHVFRAFWGLRPSRMVAMGTSVCSLEEKKQIRPLKKKKKKNLKLLLKKAHKAKAFTCRGEG